MNWVIKFLRGLFSLSSFLPTIRVSRNRVTHKLLLCFSSLTMIAWKGWKQLNAAMIGHKPFVADWNFVSLLPDAFETNSWATLSETISGEPLPNWPEESWVVVCPGSISSSAWLLAGWHSGFSYRPASWRSCIQFVSRLRVEIALINALTVILTQGFFSLGFVLTVVGNAL